MARPGNFFGNFKDFALAFSGISYCLITILPIQEVINHSYERQMVKLEEITERQQVAEELRKQGRVRPCEPLCALPRG